MWRERVKAIAGWEGKNIDRDGSPRKIRNATPTRIMMGVGVIHEWGRGRMRVIPVGEGKNVDKDRSAGKIRNGIPTRIRRGD